MKPVKMAVVGLGYWGPNLARNISTCPNTSLEYLVELDPERLARIARLYPAAKAVSDLKQALNDPELEAVAIATPVESHYPLAKACLEAGKHVLVEKPMTKSVVEAEELVALASRKGLKLMVDHTYNYTSAVQKIRDMVQNGDLGDILYWDSVRINLGLFNHDVNVVWDLAPHDLAVLDYVLGESPVSLQAKGVAHYADKLENIAYLTLNFESQRIAHFHFNWLAPVKVRTTMIGGTRKMIVYDDMEPSEKVKVYDKGVHLNGGDAGRYTTLVQYRVGDMYAPHIANIEALQVEIAHVARVIRDQEEALTGGDLGLRVVRILEAAQQSIERHGETVYLKPTAAAR